MSAVDEVFDQRAELRSVAAIAHVGEAALGALEDILGEDAPVTYAYDRIEEMEAGVKFILDNPAATLSAQHEAWIARNRARLNLGDPRLVPFDQLQLGQQLKARLWRHICHAMIG